ncbi:MAG: proline--tRNA ligase [Candidatus Saccharibacteria bacterium]
MKVSQLLMPTLREDPADAEVISHKLLTRAGMIRKASGGIYTFLPLGYRVIRKIMQIVREEMDRAGAQEILMPIAQPRELWEQTGRWQAYGNEMFRLKDRHDREFCLGPTHEELITNLVSGEVHSYRDLPLMLYQIQDKFRDEIRPRFGLLRGREFIMKDCYSFDVDEQGLDESYRKMYDAYEQIYQRMDLEFRAVEADTGTIGGNVSHEFTVLASNGESVIVYCDTCSYAANVEKAECLPPKTADKQNPQNMEKVATPNVKTVEEVVSFLKSDNKSIIKTLIYLADEKPYAALVRGDRELNEIKLKNYLDVNDLILAREEVVRDVLGVGTGSIGPVEIKIPVIADLEIEVMTNAVCGANEDGHHFKNVNPGRDFKPQAYVDLRNAVASDSCPHCEGHLLETRGIEVGQVFKLGTKYSKSLNAVFSDEQGNTQPSIMGCYGIGVSRTMAAIVEQKNDADGIIWPLAVAPYHVIIIPVNIKDEEQMKHAVAFYEALQKAGIEVLLDDRDERAGVKFKDADLIGIPLRITLGPKALKEGKVEFKRRWEQDNQLIELNSVIDAIVSEVKAAL